MVNGVDVGQGGAAKTENNEDVARGIVKLVQGNEGVKQAAEKFLEENKDIGIKETDLNDEKKVVELFQGPKGKEFFKAIKDHLQKDEEFTKLIKQIDKGPTIVQKADSLGKKLAVGMGEVAFGGLLSAGLAAAPFIGLGILAFVAIAAIGFVLFKNKEKIGEKAKDIGKKATQLLKNVIDKLPLRSPNDELQAEDLIVDNEGSIEVKNEKGEKEVKAKQDIIHDEKKLQTPLPSSALHPGSIANTELLKNIDEDKRRGVKDLLEKASGLKNTGQNEGFRQDFHNVLKGSYDIEGAALEGNDSDALKTLAGELKNLKPTQIRELSAKVDDLKKDQSRGAQSRMSKIEKAPEQLAPSKSVQVTDL